MKNTAIFAKKCYNFKRRKSQRFFFSLSATVILAKRKKKLKVCNLILQTL